MEWDDTDREDSGLNATYHLTYYHEIGCDSNAIDELNTIGGGVK